MKKMKATLAIAMASVLTIGLVGCGSSSAPAATEQTSAAAGTDTTASAEATTTASGSDLNIMLEISYLHGREQQILKLLPNIPIC